MLCLGYCVNAGRRYVTAIFHARLSGVLFLTKILIVFQGWWIARKYIARLEASSGVLLASGFGYIGTVLAVIRPSMLFPRKKTPNEIGRANHRQASPLDVRKTTLKISTD